MIEANNLNTTEKQKLNLAIIRSRITAIDNTPKISNEQFSILADEFAEHLITSFGLDGLDNLQTFAPLCGKFWQLQYVVPETH